MTNIRPGGRIVRAENARPLVRVDECYDDGDPDWETVKYETDFAPFKAATDVVVIGSAFAPGGEPVPYLDAIVEVGDRRKAVRVSGDRHCCYRWEAPPAFSEPVPFTEMPIRYDRAYGGRDTRSDPEEPFYYPRTRTPGWTGCRK